MSARIEVYNLLEEYALAGGNSIVTPTIDLRVGISRVNSIVARGLATVSQPNYVVEWAGGITTSEIMGTATGDIDRFQIFAASDVVVPADNTFNPPLISTMADGNFGLGYEGWIVAPMPAILWPFIRWRVTSEGGSPTAMFSLFATVQRRFD